MTSWRTLIALSLPLLLGMRDPFQPQEDRCSAAQIALWHYRGSVGSGEKHTAFVLDAGGKWRRLMLGQTLENGWRVADIQPAYMDMNAGAECELSQWRWLKEGTEHDSKGNSGTADDDGRGLGQGKGRLAGSG